MEFEIYNAVSPEADEHDTIARLIPITDEWTVADPRDDWENNEPHPGSIVMTNGEFGTAWQRYFVDGMWHRVGNGRPRTWTEMLEMRLLVLVYAAPERPESMPTTMVRVDYCTYHRVVHYEGHESAVCTLQSRMVRS